MAGDDICTSSLNSPSQPIKLFALHLLRLLRLARLGRRRSLPHAPCALGPGLPPLDGVIQVFLSSDDPLASPADWMAVASQRYGNNIFFFRPGDAAWSALCDRPTAGIESVAFHGGRVYCLDWMRVLVGCDLNNPGASPAQISGTSGPMSRLCSCDRYHGVCRGHVVSCAGDLLLVVVRKDSDHPSFAEIYKLELPHEPGRPIELGVRVTDLGDYSLFLAPGESFALFCQGIPCYQEEPCLRFGTLWEILSEPWPQMV